MFKKIILISILLLLLVIMYGCQYNNGPQQILITSEKFTLAWDPPNFDTRTIIYTIEFYRVYYRELGQVSWNMLALIPGDEDIEYQLHYSDFGSGMYEFAVDYVQSNGQASSLHASHDHTAIPIGGWYVLWLGLE